MKVKLAILFFGTASLFCGNAQAGFAFNYDVNMYAPVSGEPNEDPVGGIWYTYLAATGTTNPILGNGLIMCSGDSRAVGVLGWQGPYAAVDFLSTPPEMITSDPGTYTPGVITSRDSNVKAKTAYLVDQMYSTLGGTLLDTECHADALTAAVQTIWSGLSYTYNVTGDDTGEATLRDGYYHSYMASVAGVTAANYTSSKAVWLVGSDKQVLFAEFLDFTPIPEPSSNVGLMALVSLGLFIRQRRV